MKDQVDRLLAALESDFDAAVTSAEETAASDLAVSLEQDVPVGYRILRGGWAVTTSDGTFPVDGLGRDYVSCGERLFPLDACVLEGREGARPRSLDDSLLQVLRRAVRSRARIEVVSGAGSAAGHLVGCGSDHLRIVRGANEILVPLASVRSIRLSREG